MADVVDKATRSRMMSGIKGKDTHPEMTVRKAFYRDGLRYRLHVSDLPGRPDLVFVGRRAVVFVHGCFWHGHSCHFFKWPSSRREFWRAKIDANRNRDRRVLAELESRGWRWLIIWECALRGAGADAIEAALRRASNWVRYGVGNEEIQGAG